jgi:HCOMODA/2-hydroxy-3-carboxy-muconic semialdehyde decarboxylase
MREDAQGADAATDVAIAARTLSRLGLVTAFGHVSVRTKDGMLITPPVDLADTVATGLVPVAIGAATLPAGAPPEGWVHLCLYRARSDIGAIARAQPAAANAVSVVATTVRPRHGQAAWLGRAVPVHDDARLLRTADLARSAAAALPEGEALLLRGNGAITVGASPGIAVARMWLLARSCELVLSTQDGRGLSDAEIDSWRLVAEEMLPRLWRHLRDRSRECS